MLKQVRYFVTTVYIRFIALLKETNGSILIYVLIMNLILLNYCSFFCLSHSKANIYMKSYSHFACKVFDNDV